MTIFKPFRVYISPNWDLLLKDYNLSDQFSIKTQEEKLNDQKHGLDKFDVITGLISFTFLRSEGDGYLIYNNNHNSFHTEVDIRERMERIKFPQGSPSSMFIFEYSPVLWIKEVVEGYNIGIITPESFKKAVGNDKGDIKIATIPYSLFGMPEHKPGVVIKPDELGEELKKNGWVKSKLDFDELMYMDIRHAYWRFEHKYFTVQYQCI